MVTQNGKQNGLGHDEKLTGTLAVKAGLAQMLKGGVLIDAPTADQPAVRN